LRVVFDIEANGLENPTKVWLIVCKDLDTGTLHIFKRPSEDEHVKQSFLAFALGVNLWVGHHCLGYDYPVLNKLLGLDLGDFPSICRDTYVGSKLFDTLREEHSVESYGEEFGLPKLDFKDFSKYVEGMDDYCIRDVEITYRVHNKFARYYAQPYWHMAVDTEQRCQAFCASLTHNGFGFSVVRATKLLDRVNSELAVLDSRISEEFPSRPIETPVITPRVTKYGTLNRNDFRWLPDPSDLSDFTGGPFCRLIYRDFNPDSHKQRIEVLARAGWQPTEKTKTHIEVERQARRKDRDPAVDWDVRLKSLSVTGWKISETNLNTLPRSAPSSAKSLARRITVESRRRTLTEWLDLVGDDERIHGKFVGIGAWTQRMSHQNPNMANIANSHDLNGKEKYLGAEMRSLFIAPKGKLLVGVDADGIQMRILAHYIKDEEFTQSLVTGSKEHETDTHSLNKRVLGVCCKTRDAAKRFVYALILGAGVQKLAQILDASIPQAREALDRLLTRYQGWVTLRDETAKEDARRGFFVGLDGRRVRIFGDTISERQHLAMSGYLQNGESLIMKMATIRWMAYLASVPGWRLVNLVHDEWQTECDNDLDLALLIAQTQCRALKEVGEQLKLNCPLLGTYGKNHDDPKTWTIGSNWKVTH
jgi:DNA polymerase I